MVKLFLGLSVIFTYLLMVMGNVVTTTESGLACPDWPLCYGTVIPPLNINIWFEWSHRLLGGLTGFFILASAALAWRKTRGAVRWLTGSALALLGLGAAMGGVIVLIEAPLLETTLHLAVISFHIILATVIFTLLILSFRFLAVASRLAAGDTKAGASSGFFSFYPVLFGAIFIQVILGILVRYSEASLACAGFPLCNGMLVPDLGEFEVAIHFIHRLSALAIFVYVTGNFISAVKTKRDTFNASVTLALVLIQGTLGAYVVLSGMFLPYVILHGATGFLLLGWAAYRSAPCFMSGKAMQRAMA